MKMIKYQIVCYSYQWNSETGEDDKVESLVGIESPYTKENEELAKRDAYNGEYTVEDDGQPDPEAMPTQLDIIEAQVAYTAMMTDTLLEV